MNLSNNRFTTSLFFVACFAHFLAAQTFETGIPPDQVFPSDRGITAPLKNTQTNALNLTDTGIGDPGKSAHQPFCAFDEINALHSAEDPAFRKELQRYLDEIVPALALNPKTGLEPLLTVPVVVHIIHNGETIGQGANLSDEQVKAQIAILNQDFSALNKQFINTPAKWAGLAGIPNIQFCLASVDPNGNPTNGITHDNLQVTGTSWNSNNINAVIKPATKWDPIRYFNVYVLPIPGTTSSGGVVGFSNYPTLGQIGAENDGVVIDYRWFGAPGFSTSGWRALTHETGHYLGLPHTFNGSSCLQDDGISDTPNIEKSTRELITLDCTTTFPAAPVSCGNEHLYVNYMDYVTENCYTSFTMQQVNIMRAVLNGTSLGFGYGSRNNLLVNAPSLCEIAGNDAGITRIINPSGSSCTAGTIQPVVTLRNFGSTPLSSVRLITRVNTLKSDTMHWQGNMFPGENLNVNLAAFSPPEGNYTLSIYSDYPNGIVDERHANDSISGNFSATVITTPPMVEDFENETSFPVSTGIFSLNVTEDDFKWELSNDVSAWGQGQVAVVYNNYAGDNSKNPFGTIDALITRTFNLTNLQGAQLKFDIAYAPFDNVFADTFLVLIATNCSQNYNQLAYKKGGAMLATAPATTLMFTPLAAQWRTETIDLSNWNGEDDVSIAFVNASRWGNRLFLDNIRLIATPSCTGFQASTSASPVSCFGGTNGTVSVTPENGTAPYNFKWSQGATTSEVNNLSAGNYFVTVTDVNGCPATSSVTVTQPATALTLTTNVTHETAVNIHNGTASVSAGGGTPGYQYAWNNGTKTASISNLAAGIYTVTVTDNAACTATASVVVKAFTCENFETVITWTNVTCNALNDGTASVLVNGSTPPVNYQWSNGKTTQMISGLPAGPVSVVVSDGAGCSSMLSTTITEPPNINLSISHTNETSQNAKNGTATATVSGGTPGTGGIYQYKWSNEANSAMIQNLTPGTYTLTVTDNKGCTATGQAKIEAYNCTVQISVTSMPASCPVIPDGSAEVTTVTGGNGPYKYLWPNGQTTFQATGLLAGSYTVTVTDNSGCAATGSIQVSANDQIPPVVVGNNITVYLTANGTVSLDAAQVGSGSYDNCSLVNLQVSPQGFNCSHIGPNTVTLTVTDAAGNVSTGTATVTVLEQMPPVITCPAAITTQTCGAVQYTMPVATDNCGTTTLTLTGGFHSGSVFPSGITTVSWQAKDGSGNTASCSFNVQIINDLKVQYVISEPKCHGDKNGYVDIQIQGGTPPYNALWSNGSGPLNLPAGEYTVTVTDGKNCSVVEPLSIGQPDVLVFNLISITGASNGQANGVISFSINGGTGPFGLEWSSGGVVVQGFDPVAALPGVYQVKVTDANGCTVTSGLIKVDNLTAAEEKTGSSSVKLFPNPSSALLWLSVDFPERKRVEVSFFDLTGRMISRTDGHWMTRQTELLETNDMSAGIYWVKILAGEDVFWQKIVIVK